MSKRKTNAQIKAEIARLDLEIEMLKELPGNRTPDGKDKNETLIRLTSYAFVLRWVLGEKD